MKEKVFIVAKIFGIPFTFELSKRYDVSNDFINLKNIKFQSHIEYIAESGVIITNDSENESNLKDALIYARSWKKTVKSFVTPKIGDSRNNVISSRFNDVNDNDNVISSRFNDVNEMDKKALENYDKKALENYDKKLKKYDFKSIFSPNVPFDFGKDGVSYFQFRHIFPSSPSSNISGFPNGSSLNSSFDLSQSNLKQKFLKEEKASYSATKNDISIDEESKNQSFSVSNLFFYLLKNFFTSERIYSIEFYYTELEDVSLFWQLISHAMFILVFAFILSAFIYFEASHENVIEELISKLPSQKYNSSLGINECSICLDTFNEEQDVRVLECRHCYHLPCIDSWLKNNLKCPLCRSTVSKMTDSTSYQIYQAITNG